MSYATSGSTSTTGLWDRYVQGPGSTSYIGINKDIGSGGSQNDYGVIEGGDAFVSADPRLAEEYGYLGYNSSRRAVHRYNGPDAGTNNQIVHATFVSHPDPTKIAVYFEDGFHADSQTFFFKTGTIGQTYPWQQHYTNGWRHGWEPAHFGINHLYTAYILNPWSRTLEEELDFVKEQWMFTHNDPNVYQTALGGGTGQSRSIGRTYFGMAQIAVARGIHATNGTYAPNTLLHRVYIRSRDALLRISTPGTSQPWPKRMSMWGYTDGKGLSIIGSMGGTFNAYRPDATNPSTQTNCYASWPFAPWEQLIAPYGFFAAYKLAVEDGVATTYGQEHLQAAAAIAHSMIKSCVVWSTHTDPHSQYPYRCGSGPWTTTAPSTGFLQQNPANPYYMKVQYRHFTRLDSAGYVLAPSTTDVANFWYFSTFSQEAVEWCAPSAYLLATGQLDGANDPEAQAYHARLVSLGSANFNQRWRWGN